MSARNGAVDADRLAAVRSDIDAIDTEIIDAIARRVTLARAVGDAKQRAGHPVLDPAREAAVVSSAVMRARAVGLPEDEIRALYWRLVAMSRRAQLDA
jgi:chorismate mutase